MKKLLFCFSVLIGLSSCERTEIDFDNFVLEDFLAAHDDTKKPLRLSLATFKRGINELEDAQIIAKTVRQGRYFINPNFVFNGDRIAFTTVIERVSSSNKETDIDDQLELSID